MWSKWIWIGCFDCESISIVPTKTQKKSSPHISSSMKMPRLLLVIRAAADDHLISSYTSVGGTSQHSNEEEWESEFIRISPTLISLHSIWGPPLAFLWFKILIKSSLLNYDDHWKRIDDSFGTTIKLPIRGFKHLRCKTHFEIRMFLSHRIVFFISLVFSKL